MQPTLQEVGVPERPFGVRAIGFDVRLMVGFTHFTKKLLKMLVEVGLGHSAFMLVSLPSLVKRRFVYLKQAA
jgi:hypothetical protein